MTPVVASAHLRRLYFSGILPFQDLLQTARRSPYYPALAKWMRRAPRAGFEGRRRATRLAPPARGHMCARPKGVFPEAQLWQAYVRTKCGPSHASGHSPDAPGHALSCKLSAFGHRRESLHRTSCARIQTTFALPEAQEFLGCRADPSRPHSELLPSSAPAVGMMQIIRLSSAPRRQFSLLLF